MAKNALFICLLVFSSWGCAQVNSQSIELAKIVPIADVHMHTYQQNPRPASWWREMMDANGVKWGGAVGDYREDVQAELGIAIFQQLVNQNSLRYFLERGEVD